MAVVFTDIIRAISRIDNPPEDNLLRRPSCHATADVGLPARAGSPQPVFIFRGARLHRGIEDSSDGPARCRMDPLAR